MVCLVVAPSVRRVLLLRIQKNCSALLVNLAVGIPKWTYKYSDVLTPASARGCLKLHLFSHEILRFLLRHFFKGHGNRETVSCVGLSRCTVGVWRLS